MATGDILAERGKHRRDDVGGIDIYPGHAGGDGAFTKALKRPDQLRWLNAQTAAAGGSGERCLGDNLGSPALRKAAPRAFLIAGEVAFQNVALGS